MNANMVSVDHIYPCSLITNINNEINTMLKLLLASLHEVRVSTINKMLQKWLPIIIYLLLLYSPSRS